jgi:hypothetical protein
MSVLHFAIALLVAQTVDLTQLPTTQADWKIVESRSGGNIGSSVPQERVSFRLETSKAPGRDELLFFSVIVKNTTRSRIMIPVSRNSKQLQSVTRDVTYRSLLIQLESQSGKVLPVELFGSHRKRRTLRQLAPGESLELKLSAPVEGVGENGIAVTQARISCFDVTLTRKNKGYVRSSNFIRQLSGIAE